MGRSHTTASPAPRTSLVVEGARPDRKKRQKRGNEKKFFFRKTTGRPFSFSPLPQLRRRERKKKNLPTNLEKKKFAPSFPSEVEGPRPIEMSIKDGRRLGKFFLPRSTARWLGDDGDSEIEAARTGHPKDGRPEKGKKKKNLPPPFSNRLTRLSSDAVDPLRRRSSAIPRTDAGPAPASRDIARLWKRKKKKGGKKK
jgi:hypothetical protein